LFVIQVTYTEYYWWRGCAFGRATDLWFTGCGFESWLGTIVQWPWTS